MTDKEKLPTEKQIAIYDMLDAKCTVTDEGVQGFMTWEQIRGVYNIIEETKEIDFEKELRKYFGQVKDFTLCMNIAKKFYDKGYFDGHIHDGDRIVHVDGRKVNVSRFRRVAKPLEEPVSDGLEEAADNALSDVLNTHEIVNVRSCLEMFKFGSKWQKSNLWKPADGDDMPEIDREVIALLDNGKVVFAHRPPEYWDGKNITTGKVTRNYPKTYDKGGWNVPNIKYWLDVELPKEIEL